MNFPKGFISAGRLSHNNHYSFFNVFQHLLMKFGLCYRNTSILFLINDESSYNLISSSTARLLNHSVSKFFHSTNNYVLSPFQITNATDCPHFIVSAARSIPPTCISHSPFPSESMKKSYSYQKLLVNHAFKTNLKCSMNLSDMKCNKYNFLFLLRLLTQTHFG